MTSKIHFYHAEARHGYACGPVSGTGSRSGPGFGPGSRFCLPNSLQSDDAGETSSCPISSIIILKYL